MSAAPVAESLAVSSSDGLAQSDSDRLGGESSNRHASVDQFASSAAASSTGGLESHKRHAAEGDRAEESKKRARIDAAAEAETQRQSAAAPSAAAADYSAAPSSLVASLYRDALHSIFSFISLADLATRVVRVSRSWRSAVESLPPRAEQLQLANSARLTPLLHSPLRRLVSSLALADRLAMPSVLLLDLSERMPHLTALECAVGPDSVTARDSLKSDAEAVAAADVSPASAFFPPSLLFLTFRLATGVNWMRLERLLDAVATSCPQLAALRLEGWYSGAVMPPTMLDPLRRLAPALHTLRLAARAFHLRQPHIDVIRSLPNLTQLKLNTPLQLSQLQLLTADPPRQLRDIGELWRVSDEEAACLAKLSGLSSLHIMLLCADPSFLTRLPHLHRLHLDDCSLVDSSRLSCTLSRCTRLTELKLRYCRMSDEQLTTTLASGSRLERLILHSAPQLQSLAAFSQLPHLRQSLRELTLWSCGRIPPNEVDHLLALSALESLDLKGSFSSPLSESTLQLLSESAEGRSMRASRGLLPSLKYATLAGIGQPQPDSHSDTESQLESESEAEVEAEAEEG